MDPAIIQGSPIAIFCDWRTQAAIRRVAEQRIREAMDAGKFDNLPGRGQPIPCVSEVYDDYWWLRRWIKREKLNDGLLRDELTRAIQKMRQSKSDTSLREA